MTASSLPAAVADLLEFLYGPQEGPATASRLAVLLDAYRPRLTRGGGRREWTQADAVLITYGDSVRTPAEAPLATLASVLPEITGGLVPTVHLLPFYPSTSDDGFSVVDYLAVDPSLGTWADVMRLGERAELMFDAVINHVSASSSWFRDFLAGAGHADWFLTVPEGADTSQVVRPRTLPLLTPFDTARGPLLVWTTFSADQVDLDYRTPAVLLSVVEVLLQYVARGASVIRLDAVTYLWKRLGTSCVHLPETHAVIRLVRAVLDELAPQVTLITETNVPHAQNVSYFGDGHGEAQLVYNFALPPLVLHSFLTRDASALSAWASALATPSDETHFFNFLASHDGVGVRGAEDILSPADLARLGATVEAHGGLVGYRTLSDGTAVPYELNVNYFDALNDPDAGEDVTVQVDRFLTAQSIMLTLPGVPGIYLHSLVGSRGWSEGVTLTGAGRTINREKLDRDELLAELQSAGGRRHLVNAGFRRMLRVRAAQRAFAPGAPAAVVPLGPGAFALARGEGSDRILCVHNVTEADLPLPAGPRHDLLTDTSVARVPARGVVWLKEA